MATPTAASTTDLTGCSTTATIPPPGQGADDPGQLVGVNATELFGWAWLAAELADWLTPAAHHQAHHRFDNARRPEQTAALLTQISQRLAALLAQDRGQP